MVICHLKQPARLQAKQGHRSSVLKKELSALPVVGSSPLFVGPKMFFHPNEGRAFNDD
jgi:hypothetical protein